MVYQRNFLHFFYIFYLRMAIFFVGKILLNQLQQLLDILIQILFQCSNQDINFLCNYHQHYYRIYQESFYEMYYQFYKSYSQVVVVYWNLNFSINLYKMCDQKLCLSPISLNFSSRSFFCFSSAACVS